MTISSIIQTVFLILLVVLAAVTFYTNTELSIDYFKAMATSGKVVYKEVRNYTEELVPNKTSEVNEDG